MSKVACTCRWPGSCCGASAALLEDGGCEPDLDIAAGSGGVCLHVQSTHQHQVRCDGRRVTQAGSQPTRQV